MTKKELLCIMAAIVRAPLTDPDQENKVNLAVWVAGEILKEVEKYMSSPYE